MSPPAALTWEEIYSILTFKEPAGIQRLYKAIFGVRVSAPNKEVGITLLRNALSENQAESVLFRHECCYLLGQLGADASDVELKKAAFETLLRVLADTDENEVTRHEAAEGIAAVFNYNLDDALSDQERGDIEQFFERKLSETFTTPDQTAVVEPSEQVGNDADQPVRQNLLLNRNRILISILSHFASMETALGQTCVLAVEGLKRDVAKVCACQYVSYDPAIGDSTATEEDIPRFMELLSSPDTPFYQRYVAMFTLRNLKAEEQLAQVLDQDVSSPVLRHEICFVLGQMESETARDALIRNLCKTEEHEMVRHESAIALGSIGTEKSKVALRKFVEDQELMVAESCLVALDTIAYWEAWEAEEERIKAS